MMRLRMEVMRSMRRGGSRGDTLISLLEVEGQLRLVGQMGIGGRATLGRNGRYGNGRFEHIQVGLVLIARTGIPNGRSFVGRRNPPIEGVILICLFCTFFFHPFDGIELMLEGWSL